MNRSTPGFPALNLANPYFLEDMDLLVARGTWTWPWKGLNHILLVQQLGADGHYDLANMGPGHWALGLSKGTLHTCLEPRLGIAWGQTGMSVEKACLQGPLGQPIQAAGRTHYQVGRCLWSLHARPWRKEHSWPNWRQFKTLLHRHKKYRRRYVKIHGSLFKRTMKNFRTIGNNNLINYSLSPMPRFKCGTLSSAINEAFKNKIQSTLNSFRTVLKMCFPL